MDRVNIIMATYQGEKYIREQLDSILQSEGVEYMISIFDDGSKDHTVNIVESYQNEYPDKIQLVQNKKNLGHFANFMQGVIGNPYDYLMFCDQDDVWNPDKITKTYQFMKQQEVKHSQKTPLVVFTDATIVDENLKMLTSSFHQSGRLNTSKLDFAHMLMENKMMGCTMMLNQAMIQKVTELPTKARYHDWWVALIAAAFGHIEYLPEQTLLYRQHGDNVVGNLSFLDYVKNRLNSISKQRHALQETIWQAEELKRIYGKSIPKESKELLEQFVTLGEAGFIKRRYLLLKYGFVKSGVVRNIGLFILI